MPQERRSGKRVEAEGRGSGSRRDQGIASRWACGKVSCMNHVVHRCHVQAGCLYMSFKMFYFGIVVFGGRVKNFMFQQNM